MGTYRIRVIMDERFHPGDLELDMRTNQLHPLHCHDVRIGTSAPGGTSLELSVSASDLWTAILTTMCLTHHIGYVPITVEARSDQTQE